MLKTFRTGGIHPPENKQAANCKITALPVPAQVVIPLNQHIGAPAEAVVKKGDPVKVGTLLAKAGGFVSANVHSSVSGIVQKIGDALQGNGTSALSVFIDVAGDEWEETIDRTPTIVRECALSGKEIIGKIAAAGIVGLGGATFPTHVKLSPPPGNKAEILIINGVECEPFLTSDHALMMEKGEEILTGVRLLMKAIQVNRALIGIERNKQDAIASLTALTSEKYREIEVVPLKVKYPQGSEKQLIEALLRRKVKSEALPVSVGAVVQNVGTVFAVYEAVQKNKPLIERVVTVAGTEISRPSNLLVRVGTPVRVLLDVAGGLPDTTGKIISGGPMMGRTFVGTDVPVTKACSGILAFPAKDAGRKPADPCIRCAKCVQVCPMRLNPALLMDATLYEKWPLAEKNYIADCIECGSCTYTCPACRPLLDYIRSGKNRVKELARLRKSS
ncbi:MAG: electron transport complex subunit RsxC [Tannerella sp.]|jgi:electron transport complex protein RnfC|nr:electron transport complex subunit RsxC [Tannerella sp.]